MQTILASDVTEGQFLVVEYAPSREAEAEVVEAWTDEEGCTFLHLARFGQMAYRPGEHVTVL